MDKLFHHGIKGQKWGVRRFQDKDGSLTPEGKQRYRAGRNVSYAHKTYDDVNSIIDSMTPEDRHKVLMDSPTYLSREETQAVVKRVLEKEKNVPVAFFDMLNDGDHINLALGTRQGYRGRGYANKAVKKGMAWYDKYKDQLPYKDVVWGVYTDNIASINLAKKYGFKLDPSSYSKDKKIVNYVRR